MEEHNEEEVYYDPEKIRIIYPFLPYSFHRINRMLTECDCYLINIWQGYKANRRFGYCEHYQVRRRSTNEIIQKETTLDSLRRFFAQKGFPLYDEKSTANISKRNQSAEAFLEIVEILRHQTDVNP